MGAGLFAFALTKGSVRVLGGETGALIALLFIAISSFSAEFRLCCVPSAMNMDKPTWAKYNKKAQYWRQQAFVFVENDHVDS